MYFFCLATTFAFEPTPWKVYFTLSFLLVSSLLPPWCRKKENATRLTACDGRTSLYSSLVKYANSTIAAQSVVKMGAKLARGDGSPKVADRGVRKGTK